MFYGDVVQRPRFLAAWERTRNTRQVHWAMECFAEMFGVFLYTYIGVGAGAGWVVGNIIKQAGLSSVFQIGFAYTVGIVFALLVCGATSGGHFSPGITIAFTVFKGFPKLKAVRYIIAQLLGAYIASALVYYQWKPLIEEVEVALHAAGPAVYAKTMFTPNGPAGIFGLYLLPGQKIGWAFLNEFVNCVVLAVIIWAALDPSSYMIPPTLAPFVIGLAYGSAVWGFAVPGIALNTARDLGARLWAITVWGTAANGGTYAAVTALTNIPATIVGGLIYEIFLTDSDRVVAKKHLEYHAHVGGHRRTGTHANVSDVSSEGSTKEKPTVNTYDA